MEFKQKLKDNQREAKQILMIQNLSSKSTSKSTKYNNTKKAMKN